MKKIKEFKNSIMELTESMKALPLSEKLLAVIVAVGGRVNFFLWKFLVDSPCIGIAPYSCTQMLYILDSVN